MTLSTQAATRKDKTSASGAELQHRHFAVIAAIIADFGYPCEQKRLADHFARHLARTNPRFDRARFLRACGVEG